MQYTRDTIEENERELEEYRKEFEELQQTSRLETIPEEKEDDNIEETIIVVEKKSEETINCECGSQVSKSCKVRHLKSKKHVKWQNGQSS